MEIIAELSNLAGGIVCEHPGVVPIELGEFKRECLNSDKISMLLS